MATNKIIPFGAAVAADVLSALQIPGGSTFTELTGKYLSKKRQEAVDILIEEISQGHHGGIEFDETDIDPLLETIYRFSKAVSDGAARDNLRLLAQVIAGLKKNKALDGDRFRRWSGILEQLTRDELLVVGNSYRIQKEIDKAVGSEDEFWKQLEAVMQSAGYSEQQVDALCASVSRTGLLLPASAWDGMIYVPSPWLNELGQLADLEIVTKSTK